MILKEPIGSLGRLTLQTAALPGLTSCVWPSSTAIGIDIVRDLNALRPVTLDACVVFADLGRSEKFSVSLTGSVASNDYERPVFISI